jgi:hypothetical protein
MFSRTHVIHERSNIIPIKQNLSTSMVNLSPKGEYSLKENFFDPSKSSPPNDFMIKLHKRMLIYNSSFKDMSVDNLETA